MSISSTVATSATPLAVAKTAARVAARVPGVPAVPGVGSVARLAKAGANAAASRIATAATDEPVSPPCDGASEESLLACGPEAVNPYANVSKTDRLALRAKLLQGLDKDIRCAASKYSCGRVGLFSNWQRRIFSIIGLSIVRYCKGDSVGMGYKDVHIDSTTVLYENPTTQVHPQANPDLGLDIVLAFTEKNKPLKLLIRFDHAADKKYWVQNLCIMIQHKKW